MISVCMATYNGAKYIGEQIDSILSQISESDELIISDDGSTDDTISIISEYKDKYANVRLIKGPKKGVVANFQNAIRASKGRYIFLCDQDDIWEKKKVQTVLSCFKKTSALVVLHDAVIVDGNGDKLEDSFFEHRKTRKGFIKNIIKNSYLGCCMAFDSKMKNVVLPFPPKIEMHDWWIGLWAELLGGSVIINRKLLKYRRHTDNVSSFTHYGFTKMLSNRIYLIKEIIKRRLSAPWKEK